MIKLFPIFILKVLLDIIFLFIKDLREFIKIYDISVVLYKRLYVMSNYLKTHPNFAISMAYFYLSLCGLLYQYFLLKSFNINSLNFITLGDFFLSFIKSFQVLWLLILMYIINLIVDIYFYQKRIKERTNRLSFIKRFILILRQQQKIQLYLFIVFLPILSIMAATLDYGRKMQIEIDNTTSISLSIPIKSYIIDITERYVFLLDNTTTYVVRKEDLRSYKIVYDDK